MDAVKLAGLAPEAVFSYFEKICSIPHGSGNTKAISDYIVSFALEHGIRYVQDELNNVLLFAPGTCGYEDRAPVVLQGHIDMVCEKDEDCSVDPMDVMKHLNDKNIEARPIWKPMHMQPVFKNCDFITAEDAPVNEYIFSKGLCLPSDIKMTEEEQKYVIDAIKECF